MATTVETIKRVTVQGRSEGLDKVAKDLKSVEAGMKGVDAAGKQTTTTTDSQQKSVVALSAHMDRLQGRLDRVFKAEQEFERAVKRTDAALKQGAISTERHTQLMALLSGRLQQVRDDSSHAVNALTRTNFAAGHLTYQLNDVFTGLVTGQSPFMIAAQQAGQFSQILGAQGGGLRGAAALVGQAFMSMLNPINGTIIAIGAAATAIGYFMSESEDSSKAAEEGLKRHEELLSRVKARYGEIADSIGKVRAENDSWLASDTRMNVDAQQATLSGGADEFLTHTTVDVLGKNTVAQQFLEYKAAIEQFRASARGTGDVKVLLDAVGELAGQTKDGGAAMDLATASLRDFYATASQAEQLAFVARMVAQLGAEFRKAGDDATIAAGKVQGLIGLAAAAGANMERLDGILRMRQSTQMPGDHGVPPMAEPRSPGAIGTPGNRPIVQVDQLPVVNPIRDENSDYGVPKAKRGGGGGGGRDPFEAAMESARQRLQLLEQEKVALGLTGDALVRYKAEQQVLNSARGEFEKMSPAHQAALEAEAKKVGDATVELEKMKKAQEDLKTAQKQGEEALEALGSGLENVFMGIVEGGDAAKQAIMQLVAQLLKAALLGTNGGGPLGAIFGGGLLGGIVAPQSAGASSGPQRASRSSIRVPSAPRAAGNTSFSMHVAGNLDHSVMPEIRAELRSFQRDMDRRQEEREANKWRRS